MTTQSWRRGGDPAGALAAWDIASEYVRDVRTGRVNRHWRVGDNGREYALRRYATPPFHASVHTAASIAFEHDALRHAAAKGWPAPAPMTARDGTTLVEHKGAFYALFPWAGGRPAPRRNGRYLRIKGRLLARLHRDMLSFPRTEQRDGHARVWELDGYMGSGLSFNEMLRAFGKEHNDDSWTVRGQRYRSLRELSRLGYGELPDQFVHYDFHHDNVLFSRGELTGLIDFDSCHLDARVADIAVSIALDCIEPPAYNAIDPAAARAFVAGYSDGSALSTQETALIVPLVRAWIISAAAGRIAQWLTTGDERVLAKIARTVRGRIPAFEQRSAGLEQAVREGAEDGART